MGWKTSKALGIDVTFFAEGVFIDVRPVAVRIYVALVIMSCRLIMVSYNQDINYKAIIIVQ